MVTSDLASLSAIAGGSLDASLMSTSRPTVHTTSPMYCPTTNGKAKDLSTSPGYSQTAAAGDCYSGGPQRNSSYGTPSSQSYHPYRR